MAEVVSSFRCSEWLFKVSLFDLGEEDADEIVEGDVDKQTTNGSELIVVEVKKRNYKDIPG